MATKEYGVRTLAEHPRRRPRFDISEAKKRGPWGRQRQLRDKICREKIQMTRITEEYFRNVNVYYSRLCCLQFRKIRKFPCCTLLLSMTPKPLVKLIMHLRMLEFFPKCEGEWVAYLGRVKGIEKKKKFLRAKWKSRTWWQQNIRLLCGLFQSRHMTQFKFVKLTAQQANKWRDDLIWKASRMRRWRICVPKSYLTWVRIQTSFILKWDRVFEAGTALARIRKQLLN